MSELTADPTLKRVSPDQVLQRLEWRVIRRLDGLLQGDYRTLFYGTGIDFADIREYQANDDIRHIDWNVTARMDSPYVRQFVEDGEVTVWFLLDLSPSMGFGPAARPKKMVLTEYVATFARLLVRSGNRVGAILYNRQVEPAIPPRGSRNQVLRIMRAILNQPGEAGGVATDLTPLLETGLNTFKRRSLVFVISDFISEPGWERPLTLLNRRHELVGIRLWDRREVALPDAGMLVMEDAETGEQLLVDTAHPEFRRRFFAAAERREAALKATLKRAGVDLFGISTEADLVGALVRMASLRKRRRR